MKRTLVIGDVHGCLQELEDLLQACQWTPDDAVVFVGDLVAKGPDSALVLERARALRARAVLGNHDAHLLHCWQALTRGEPSPRPFGEHERLAHEVPAADLAWLQRLPLWLRLSAPPDGVVVVHAGVVPGLPLDAHPPDALMNMRTLRPDGTPSRQPDAGRLWGELYQGPELVLFGHHAMQGLQVHPHALGLDTGCVYGGRLTACILPERRLVWVPARHAYAPLDAGRLSTLSPGQARVIALPKNIDERPREALVVLDEAGAPRAYANRCRHLPVPLDAGGRRFFARDFPQLQCATHGARYRTSDGLCVAGPCAGARLHDLPLERKGDRLRLALRDSDLG